MSEVNVKTNLKLFPWQLQVMFNLKEHWKGYIHVVKSKRQCGKSILLQVILLRTAIEQRGTTSICLCPTLEQARKIFDGCKKVIKPTKLYLRHNDTQLYLRLTNGSLIMFKSAEQKDTLRGNTVTGIYCVDEAAYIPDDIFFETLPWINVSQAPIVIFSTPSHKSGFFYDYYMSGMGNEPNILSYDWTSFDTSELLPPEKLEEYRKKMPANKFRTEYLGEFEEFDSNTFGDFSSAISDVVDETLPTFMGIDFGTGQGQDDTAITVFNSKRQMRKIYHFNDKDETETVRFICDVIEEFRPVRVKCEVNSIGSIYFGLIQKELNRRGLRTNLMRFVTTNESKENLVDKFKVAIQNNEITILPDPVLKLELEMYECVINKNNKRIYNAKTGFHDDCVIATLIGFDAVSSGNYCIR